MKSLMAGLCVIGSFLADRAALSQDFPETIAAAQFSITQGFRQRSLSLLRRSNINAPEAATAALIEKLCFAPCPSLRTRSPGDLIDVTTSSWSLHVLADGSGARFRDLEVEKRAYPLARSISQKTSPESLVRAGRAYIAANLAPVIVLGSEEELVPIRADYRIEGDQNLATGEVTRSVLASRIVFGRSIRGVPIVGGGSRVVLTFTNDGALESFQYDWPKYETAAQQARSLIGVEDILGRVQRVIGVRTGVPLSTFSDRGLAAQAPNYIAELMRGTILEKLECGYYDPGVPARDSAVPIQPGCVYQVMYRGDEGDRAGFSGAVPGSTQIEADPSWIESAILRGSPPDEKVIAPGQSPAQ